MQKMKLENEKEMIVRKVKNLRKSSTKSNNNNIVGSDFENDNLKPRYSLDTFHKNENPIQGDFSIGVNSKRTNSNKNFFDHGIDSNRELNEISYIMTQLSQETKLNQSEDNKYIKEINSDVELISAK